LVYVIYISGLIDAPVGITCQFFRALGRKEVKDWHKTPLEEYLLEVQSSQMVWKNYANVIGSPWQ